MSHREPSGWSDFRPEPGAEPSAPDDLTDEGYHRARHSHAAPAPYAEHPQPYLGDPDGYAGAAVDPDAPTGAYPRVDDRRPEPGYGYGYGYDRADDGGYPDGYARHTSAGWSGDAGRDRPGDAGWDRPEDTGWRPEDVGWDREPAQRPAWDDSTAPHAPVRDTWPVGPAASGYVPEPPDRRPGAGAPAAGPDGPVAGDPAAAGGPDPVPTAGAAQPVPRKSRAGRNLPAAIGVGVGLGGVVVASLFVWKPAFLAVLVVAAGVGTWEMARALHSGRMRPPLVPLLAAVPLLAGLAWFGGPVALVPGLFAVVVATMVWRLGDGPRGYGRDVAGAVLIIVYVPFLASFAAMLAAAPDGAWRVLVTLAGVVLSDTGGYIAGVFLGRHRMAPKISPGKTWEGLAGSLVATAVGGVFLLHYLLDAGWWQGAVFGLCVSAAAVVGDLAESMIKRDLGIKDMGRLLPGHGGLMDRLDSVLIAAPTAYVLLSALAPGHS